MTGAALCCVLWCCAVQLELAVKTQQADFTDVRVADALRQVSDLELLQVSHFRAGVTHPELVHSAADFWFAVGSRPAHIQTVNTSTRRCCLADLCSADCVCCVTPILSAQAPGLAFSLPKDYANLPRLIGRATVELTVEKSDDSLAFVDTVNGGLSKQGKVCA